MDSTGKSTTEMQEGIAKFLKEAWCIDGTSVCLGDAGIIFTDNKIRALEGLAFKLTDSKRGTFYVAYGKE